MSKIIEFPSENDIAEDYREKYINYIESNLDDCNYKFASEFFKCDEAEKAAIKVVICVALTEAGYDPTNNINLSKFQIDCNIRPVSGTINLQTVQRALPYVEKYWEPRSNYYQTIKQILDNTCTRLEKRKKRSKLIWRIFLVLFVLCAAIGAWTLWDWIGEAIQFIIKK